ncbi:MAG: hypothetical protein V4804_11110 [Pseudomonadota bacterium]
MKVPFLLFIWSLGGALVAVILPGQLDYLLLAVPCVIASLYLLLAAYLRRGKADAPVPPPRRRGHAVRKKDALAHKWIVVDGSNVMHWKDGTPQIETVREVLRHLTGLGYTPGVVFDANAGYLISGKYQHDFAFGRQLGLPADRVMVVAKGTPADPTVLAAARDLGARIVTNDRYRDWTEDHPEVREPGHLIRGEYRDGKLWLDLDPA